LYANDTKRREITAVFAVPLVKSQFPIAAQVLQNWIVARKFHPGTRLPSAEKMAKQFGFTPATMLRATQTLISGGFLHRNGYKLAVAHTQTTTPSFQGIVYIVACSSDDSFVRGVERILSGRGIPYRSIDIPPSKSATVSRILTKIASEKPAGIILRMADSAESLEPWLKTTSLPVVVYAQGLHQTAKSSAQIDECRATEIALRHLHELGHRQIALFFASHNSASAEKVKFYKAACFTLGLKESIENVWYTDLFREDLIREALLTAHRRHPEVTAILARDEIAARITRIFPVPQKISVIGFGDADSGWNTRPPLTTIALRDPEALARWACTDLIEQMHALQSEKNRRVASTALFVPELTLRKSTRPITTRKTLHRRPDKCPTRLPHPSETWQNVYPFLKKKSKVEWHPLDLSQQANHSMTRHHGWLGREPLEHFPPGLRSIHGVPFQVLNEERNGGHAVITFRSPRSHSAKGKLLPTEVHVKVNLRPKALYFLHGCAYAKPVPFAEYIMHFVSGRESSVPLVPLGLTRGTAPNVPKHLQPNLQDWWYEYEQQDFPHAHRASVFDVSDPTAYERTLYSLQWINPRPKDEVTSIEVRVAPEAGPILALISVTALL